MYSKNWQVIKDDTRKTYENIGQDSNTNHFTNSIHGMQRAGMNVSYVTPPVSNKLSSKDLVKISGYTEEKGLYEKLQKQYREISSAEFNPDPDENYY